MDTDQIAPRSTFRLFGNNLYLGRISTVRFFDTGDGTSQLASVNLTGSTNYLLKVSAPSGIQAGHTYRLYVSNGFYGNSQTPIDFLADEPLTGRAGGSDYWNLSLPWAADLDFFSNVYNVKSDPRLGNNFAVGNGVSDDTWALNHAIQVAAAAGGGVVYLPSGHYTLHFSNGCGLQLYPRVVLAGQGAGQTIISYGYPVRTQGGYGICFSNSTGMIDLTMQNVDSAQQWRWSALSENNSEVFMKRVTWNIGTSQWLNFQNDNKVAIQDSTISQGLDNTFDNLGPLNMSSCSHCEVSGTTIDFVTCGILFDRASDIVFQNNQVIRDISTSPAPDTVTHSIAANFVKNFAVINNAFSSVGTGLPTNNDGEVINTEAGGAVRFDEFRGSVSSATGTTLTDSEQTFLQSPNAIPHLRVAFATVAIVSGNGLGQTRKVLSVSQDGKTIGIDRPWDVQPEQGAHYATFDWSAHNWIVAQNTLSRNFKGFEVFNDSVSNLLFQANTLADSDGIMVSPSEKEKGIFGALFNVVYGLRIIGNTFTDSLGIHPAYVGLLPREDQQTAPFGTHLLGAEVKGNNVTGFMPNVFNAPVNWDNYKVKTEGYLNAYYWQSNDAYDPATAAPPLLATIFQGNVSVNSKSVFYLDSGAVQTVMADTYMRSSGVPLEDVLLPGASQASTSLIMGTQWKTFAIGSISSSSIDLIQAKTTDTGARAITMGHQGGIYSLNTGGDNVSLLGLEAGTDSQILTRMSLTLGTTATALLMMRSVSSSSSPYVALGLASGCIVIQARESDAAPIQTRSIPFTGNSAVFKLSKRGSTISAMYSSDGSSWDTTDFSVEFSAREYIAGVGETSEGNRSGAEVSFEGLTFGPNTDPPVLTGGINEPRLKRKAARSISDVVLFILRAVRHAIPQFA